MSSVAPDEPLTYASRDSRAVMSDDLAHPVTIVRRRQPAICCARLRNVLGPDEWNRARRQRRFTSAAARQAITRLRQLGAANCAARRSQRRRGFIRQITSNNAQARC